VSGVSYSLNSREHTAIKLQTSSKGDNNPNLDVLIKKADAVRMQVESGRGSATVYNYKTTFNVPVRAPKIEQLGTKLIESVQAEGTRTTITIPAGEVGNERPIDIVDEQWRSKDLEVIVYSKHSDPRMGETVYSLVNISRADPSPSLFQVPADYTIQEKGGFTINIKK
jgi:hypothetical protein